MIEQDPLNFIAHQLETKSLVKQEAYRNLYKTFKSLQKEAQHVITQINERLKNKDKDVTLKVIKENDQEFHLKVAGDLIVFIMHTNIITLGKEHGFNKSEKVIENPFRKYLGQVNVYNFMADSFKFNRLNDPGVLLARLFVNYENHFLIEGSGQLNFMFDHVSDHTITQEDLNIFIKLLIAQAIDNDMVTPPFPEIRTISVHQKLQKSQELGGGAKMGFQMTHQSQPE